MKNFVFFLVVLALFVSSGLAQQAPFASPEEAFRSVNLKDISARKATVEKSVRKAPNNTSAIKLDGNSVPTQNGGPGEFPLFQVHTDREFADGNQDVRFTLQAQFNFPQRIWSYGVMLEPGASGQYDETGVQRYLTPAIGQFGSVPSVRAFDTFTDAFVAKMNSSSRSGEYLVMFLFFDETGTLIQQTMTYYYMRHTGPYGRFLSYIESAEFEPAKSGRNIVIKGKFPQYSPLYVLLGTPGGVQTNYFAFSLDGRTIVIPFDGWSPWRTLQWDVTVLDQFVFRQTMTKTGAITLIHDRP